MHRLMAIVSVCVGAACGGTTPAQTSEETPPPPSPSPSDGSVSALRETSAGALPRAEPEAMPAGVPRWAVSAGWGDTFFVARTDAGRIDVVVDGATEELVSGFDRPRALLVDGGRLVVADAVGVHTVALSSKEVALVAEAPGVTSLALDHVGYWVAGRADAAPLRITPDGEIEVLRAAPPGNVAFDTEARELYVVDDGGDRARVYDYLPLVGEDRAVWAARDRRPMRPFTIGEIGLTGAEYWPNRGDTPTRYPEDVLWGFYPEEGVVFEGVPSPASATPQAIACAEESFEALRAFIADPPDALGQAIALGASNRFYLWVNDYTEASDPFPHEVRPNRFWYWARDPAVVGRIPGYWKWETTLTQSGECRIPERAQALEYLEEKIEELRSEAP